MTFKPSKLPQLAGAYEAHFGTHVPLEAMKVLDAEAGIPMLPAGKRANNVGQILAANPPPSGLALRSRCPSGLDSTSRQRA